MRLDNLDQGSVSNFPNAIDITLHKEKYRSRKGPKTVRPNPGAAGNGRIAGIKPKHTKTKKTLRPRQRSWGPW